MSHTPRNGTNDHTNNDTNKRGYKERKRERNEETEDRYKYHTNNNTSNTADQTEKEKDSSIYKTQQVDINSSREGILNTSTQEVNSSTFKSNSNFKNSLALLDCYIRKDIIDDKNSKNKSNSNKSKSNRSSKNKSNSKSPVLKQIKPNTNMGTSTKQGDTPKEINNNIINKGNDKKADLDTSDVYPNESERLTMIGQYKVEQLIGKGSFGRVYRCSRNKKEYAVKLETTPMSRNSQLRNEYLIYQKLHENNISMRGIPRVYLLGSHNGCYYMVMDILGPNLHRLHEQRLILFDLGFVLKIGIRLLEIFQSIHEKGIILRDLKPDNILIHNNEVFIIDFGMSKYYIKKGKHIEKRVGKELAGTVRYASIRTHKGIEQSRRDDLECLIYSMIYLCKGKLPWMGIGAKSRREKFEKIRKKKQSTTLTNLVEGIEGGEVLADVLFYVRGLNFEEEPDYQKVRGMFMNSLKKKGERDLGIDLEREKAMLIKRKSVLMEEEERRERVVSPRKQRGWWERFTAFCFCCSK